MAIVVGVWELRRALAQVPIHVPLVPGRSAPSHAGRRLHRRGRGAGRLLRADRVGVLVWRIAEGVHDAVRDVAGGIFAAAYLPLLAGFVMLMLADRTTGPGGSSPSSW